MTLLNTILQIADTPPTLMTYIFGTLTLLLASGGIISKWIEYKRKKSDDDSEDKKTAKITESALILELRTKNGELYKTLRERDITAINLNNDIENLKLRNISLIREMTRFFTLLKLNADPKTKTLIEELEKLKFEENE